MTQQTAVVSEMRFGQAINQALIDEMDADATVVVFGEDVGAAGGSFGVSRGLQARFGESRVRDTPISEAAIVGAAVGAAMSGLRPVVEIMFMDFITLAMDALVNQAAKANFMFGGRFTVPMVLRTPHGGGLSAGPQHSQCLEAWLAHVPGLKVVIPGSPGDAYHLLRAAIRDPHPVIFVEHKGLYGSKGPGIAAVDPLPIGQARILRPGTDLTLVSYGAMLGLANKAADTLAKEGRSVEVIDLRGLQPWDETTVAASVARTHRCVVLHEAVTAFGPGAEIAARITEMCFADLAAPVGRVGSDFIPIAFAPAQEAATRPQLEPLLQRLRQCLASNPSRSF